MTPEEIEQLAELISTKVVASLKAQIGDRELQTVTEEEQETEITEEKKFKQKTTKKTSQGKLPPVATWAKPHKEKLATLKGAALEEYKTLLMRAEGKTPAAVENQVARAKREYEIELAKKRLESGTLANN